MSGACGYYAGSSCAPALRSPLPLRPSPPGGGPSPPDRAGGGRGARACRGARRREGGRGDLGSLLTAGPQHRSALAGAPGRGQRSRPGELLQLFRLIPELREPESLRSFLIGITLRVVGSELRRRRVRRWLHLTESGAVPETAGLEEDDDAREALRRFYAVLDQIGDSDRLIFVLRHIEGLELTEVAAALGTSLATTKRRLAKVMDRLLAMAERDPVLSDYLSPRAAGGSS